MDSEQSTSIPGQDRPRRPANVPHPPRDEHQPLVLVLLAVCAGIVADRYVPLSVGCWWPLAVLAWTGWLLLWRRGHMRAAVWPLVLSLAATGAAWHHCRWSLFAVDEASLAARDDSGPAALEARVIGSPRHLPPPPYNPLFLFAAPERTRLDVEVLAVRDGDRWRATSGRATVFVSGYLDRVHAADRVRIFGQWSAVRGPDNPGEFDFARRARAERRLCGVSVEFPECVTALPDDGWRWPDALSALRRAGDALLWRNLRPNRAGLAAAMFLGAREELQPEETQAFLETGTIHLLVISGLNVGILASFLFFVMRAALVPRQWALGLVAAASILYAATTDAQPPVVRATVMVLVSCAALTLGRRALAYNAIAAAGLIVLALNPEELFQPGTQLSFLCVLVLAWLAERRAVRPAVDPLQRLIAQTRRWPERVLRRVLREFTRAAVAGFVIWIVICPLVMARFHLVSPIAIVLGPLLSVPVIVAMASGFGIFAAGWLAPPLANALGWLCDANLAFIVRAVDAARAVPGSYLWVAGPSDWWLAGFYAALAVGIFVSRLRPPLRWQLGALSGWVAAGLLVPLVWQPDAERLDCTFLSVGHGAAVVVELPGGQTLLYDAGRLGSPTRASRAVAGYLWSRGITHLDAVVISHADADHFNALPELLSQFSVGAVYVSPVMFERSAPALAALEEALTRAGVSVYEVRSGDRLRTAGSARVEVLHPPQRGVLGSDNANSIVLTVEYAGRRLLLTGDLESPGLEDVVAEEPWDCDVLMAPHHGSAASDPPGFAAWSTPEWTIVSGGQRVPNAEVASAYAARGGVVLDTATCGAVHVEIAPQSFHVACWHDAPAADRGHTSP
ncbi:MAG: ComEC/Rec2 family competence protein [Pirellulales bacterium]